jgi:tetraacyldisaccharide 4'-kinase
MRAPEFWWHRTAGPAAKLLAPFAALYGSAAAWRIHRTGISLPLPVLCVGNFAVGGAGKTPTALTLGRHLIAQGEHPYFLSRGYCSIAERTGPVCVDLSRHHARDVGDEPLLLARVAPTIVGADRVAGGRLAEARGATLLILDDGLQNPALHKDLRLVLVDGETGTGNGYCLPAGPLRAPLAAQMKLASALIIVGPGAAGQSIGTTARAAAVPVIEAELVIPPAVATRLAGQRVFAFAGLGLPQKFYASLACVGAKLVGSASFADHHAYKAQEIRDLQHTALNLGAQLVTTEKDFVRLAGLADPALPQPTAVPATLEFADAGLLDQIIATAIATARERISSRAAD